jgi:hypothetical protein
MPQIMSIFNNYVILSNYESRFVYIFFSKPLEYSTKEINATNCIIVMHFLAVEILNLESSYILFFHSGHFTIRIFFNCFVTP